MKNYVKVLLLWILVSGLSFSTNAQTNTPWSEDFEGSFLPAGWTKEIADPVNDITQDVSQNHTTSGTYSARFSSYETSTNYNQYMIMDVLLVIL